MGAAIVGQRFFDGKLPNQMPQHIFFVNYLFLKTKKLFNHLIIK